jgi:hypothetical protein
VIATLFNSIDDDVDNIKSDDDELCTAMEVLLTIREIDPEVDGKHVLGLTCGATNVVDPFCHPSEALAGMPSTSKNVLSRTIRAVCTLVVVTSVPLGWSVRCVIVYG